jgi:formylglycine-generating enzyme required for sulfatase activity
MRLPTEAEWEYAARGATGLTPSRYGDVDRVAWYDGNGGGRAIEVGQKQANARGLYDMLGNVWEWVADWYGDPYTPAGIIDPQGAATGRYRVARGGSWFNDPGIVRASYRGGFEPDPESPNNFFGIRCAGNWQAALVPPPASGLIAGGEGGPPERVPRPGAVKVNAKDGLKYVWIPPGTFTMGCSAGDMQCRSDEKPAHEVTITKGFWMGETEVTQEAYQRVWGTNPSGSRGARLPVEKIDWYEAQSYCQAVGMRLPTEAEWEYAARGAAGSTPNRYGDLDRIAWHVGDSAREPHEAGQKQANAFGLYDMLGNVSEWVADWSERQYTLGSAIDPKGPEDGPGHVLRGGSWYQDPRETGSSYRASYRDRGGPKARSNLIGVRCAGN